MENILHFTERLKEKNEMGSLTNVSISTAKVQLFKNEVEFPFWYFLTKL